MKVFPIFLNSLHCKQCIVVGGDHEAEQKAHGLLECDANVTVISASATDALRRWAEEGRLRWIARDYRPGDLRGAFLVIAIRKDQETNRTIFEEAEAGNALVNVMDDVPHCNFVAGSVVRQGPLVVSISTSGAAPALAVRMRQQMEQQFGPEYAAFLEIMHTLRASMAAHYPDFTRRKAVWYELVDSGLLELIRERRLKEAHRLLEKILGFHVPFENIEKSEMLT
jgi:precorrin-2 dehydrogenase / sirohydrochlorin ferrochelatase